MSVNPELIQQLNSYFDEAFSVVNSQSEVVMDSAPNRLTVALFLSSEGVPKTNWTPFAIQLAILECNKQGTLERRKTRAEVYAAREQADRAPGSAAGNAAHNREARTPPTAEELAEAKRSFADATNPQERIRRQEQEKAAANDAQIKLERQIMADLPLDTPYHLMKKEDRKKFGLLSAASIKTFLRRQAEYDRAHPKVNTDE